MAAAGIANQNQPVEDQQPTNPTQSELTQLENRLETRMDDKFRKMRVLIMSDLHKLLEFGLGKKISAENTPNPQDGVLGSQPPNIQASGSTPVVNEKHNSTIQTQVIEVEENRNQEGLYSGISS
ncbi:hypothetical protein V6N11_042814 [Hibiscus sabdariffa]|uniref:Uncharacterized protein n=1 Tax=Hibiscus sabdariffa TaxID=183260 RepID=A0ABR2QXR2_9ROSI